MFGHVAIAVLLGLITAGDAEHRCGPGELTESHGTILSPNYPNFYENYEFCEWTITVENGRKIWLAFEAFTTESRHDELQITDPYITDDNPTSEYSGDSPPQPRISVNNTLQLRFSADESSVRTGFNISYRLACDELATVTVPNGEIIHSTLENGFVYEVICNDRYTASAEYLNTCDGSSGVAEWSHPSEPLPTCDQCDTNCKKCDDNGAGFCDEGGCDDHYSLKNDNTCEQRCMDKFEDKHISYGTPLYNPVRLYTEDECKDACRNNATCTGLDFNYDVPPYLNASCWLHGPDAGHMIPPDMNVAHFHDTCK